VARYSHPVNTEPLEDECLLFFFFSFSSPSSSSFLSGGELRPDPAGGDPAADRMNRGAQRSKVAGVEFFFFFLSLFSSVRPPPAESGARADPPKLPKPSESDPRDFFSFFFLLSSFFPFPCAADSRHPGLQSNRKQPATAARLETARLNGLAGLRPGSFPPFPLSFFLFLLDRVPFDRR